MRDFNKVSPTIWRSKRLRALRSLEAKLLLLYYHTNEHQRSCGSYRLPSGYAMTDLDWNAETYHAVRKDVIESGAVMFDEDTEELFIVDWFKTNPPMNDRHAIGCRREIGKIDSDVIREAVEEAFLQVEENRAADRSRDTQQKVVDYPGRSHLMSTRLMNRGQQ